MSVISSGKQGIILECECGSRAGFPHQASPDENEMKIYFDPQRRIMICGNGRKKIRGIDCGHYWNVEYGPNTGFFQRRPVQNIKAIAKAIYRGSLRFDDFEQPFARCTECERIIDPFATDLKSIYVHYPSGDIACCFETPQYDAGSNKKISRFMPHPSSAVVIVPLEDVVCYAGPIRQMMEGQVILARP
ncbi:MAG: hypothetical protein NT001_03740 [Candidatus Woesearchaeota archaeon]|nr:hypothetical protein [Candidatus Woesearchaeota archaeon]